MKGLHIKLSKVLPEYKDKIKDNMVEQHGLELAQKILYTDVYLSQAFDFSATKEGGQFWAQALFRSKAAEVSKEEFIRLVGELYEEQGVDMSLPKNIEMVKSLWFQCTTPEIDKKSEIIKKLNIKVLDLPEGIKQKAIDNIYKEHGPKLSLYLLTVIEIGIMDGFDWGISKEGYEYWRNMVIELKVKEIGKKAYEKLMRENLIEHVDDIMELHLEKTKKPNEFKGEFVDKKGDRPFEEFEISLN
jgi:hypothetical protein